MTLKTAAARSDLAAVGMGVEEVVYRTERGRPVEDRRERVDPRHVKRDAGRLYLDLGPGGRCYFEDVPGKFVVEGE